MIPTRHSDFPEVIERRAVFMHVAAHHHSDLAIWTHRAIGDFPVAHVAGLYSTTKLLRERSRSADD